jgi:N-acetylmuramoyl-L-alanine amidase
MEFKKIDPMNPRLSNVNRIILSIGHGGLSENADPGAIDSKTGVKENAEAKIIVAKLAAHLTANGFTVLMLPDFSLAQSIRHVNEIGNARSDWALEIHKDSTESFKPTTQATMMGVYYHPTSKGSKDIAESLVANLKNAGANLRSWSRPDTVSNHGRLGWIRQPKMLSHIIEAGFIQDSNTEADHEKYALLIAKAICGVMDKVF